jgi:hypothetical protein
LEQEIELSEKPAKDRKQDFTQVYPTAAEQE